MSDIFQLTKFHNSSVKRKLVRALQNLVKAVICYPGKSSWIHCMPLLHFLDGKCKLWETASIDVQHEQHLPIWGGTVIENTNSLNFSALKTTQYDSQALREIEKTLNQYSEADYLLPRSFMASVCPDQLSTVVRFEVIPPDVVLATLCYFIKTDATIHNSDTENQTINNCLSAVIEKSKTLNKGQSLEFARSVWRCCSIVCDVIKALKKCRRFSSSSMNMVLRVALRYMHMLHLKYENAEFEEEVKKYRKDIHYFAAIVTRRAIKMIKMKFNWKDHRYTQQLETFNLVLSSAEDDGFVKDNFTANLKDFMQNKLKSEV
ncbi:Hypothetical predicted protein [Mytilus galloprovincialis]|uniref:Uncharacterized protein n=1 Tax=Mytilus galloprovincialis TaxID=29158 RepID=A0A8B6FD72_MYTGA|nr:Hypothetical predicted protein [Mytilus galloprovincialis]